MPRLVRRRSVRDRILSYLNPLDLALDLYTYLESYDWEGVQSKTSTPIGLALNLLLFVARVNCTNEASDRYDDVLRTSSALSSSAGRLGYFLRYLSWILLAVSVLNSLLCFTKKKKYRMFESNIDIEPSTPNARRVPVDSSPSASGITAILSPSKLRRSTTEYTSTTDVWEISVWDPTPISLKLFSLFSPVHCAVYFLMFPITTASKYLFPNSPSGTTSYFTALVIQAVLSLQLGQLIYAFTQQAKDKAVVQKEVLREYDNKFVHPRLNVLKRDVATQTKDDHFEASVEIYTPVFNRQGFVTHPNPNYEHFTTTTGGGYSATSGFASSSISSTPQVERQLRREQNPDYSGSVRRFNRFIKQEPQEDDTPIKSEWAMKPRRFGVNKNASTGISTGTNTTLSYDQERERERVKREKQREQRERIKRGSDAYSTIYPDLEDDNDNDENDQPHTSTNNNIVLTTPPDLQPKQSTRQMHNPNDVFLTPARAAAHSQQQPQDRFRTDLGTPRRPTFIGVGGSNNNVGMNGLVNMAVENSRSLSPTKSPMRKGSSGSGGSGTGGRPRTSSYAASLGKGVFGTPKRGI